MLTRYKGQPLPITVKFNSNPLTVYNLDYTDIVDVSMNLKKDLAADADTLYLEKTQGGGGVTVDSTENRFVMDIASTDYTSLVAGDTYFLVLAVDVGLAELLELSLDEYSRQVAITSDENRA